ncbi:hypothetical protein [Urbifossiella limnaea]|uniref:Uncharacterized protein n=1 Tax=Urbifossiella limnaea TaxID=2528023 RepID=A0A517Y120_9BACT|nr:hypothetical protein [Urbifossiella limnaea]QDU23443.1 hypothetical protein ETAA1_54430 [Urbifossiella limnaea]
MSQTIDVTGLTDEQVRRLQTLVNAFRRFPGGPPSTFWAGSVLAEGTLEYSDGLKAWAEGLLKAGLVTDTAEQLPTQDA